MVSSDRKVWEQEQRRKRIVDMAEAVFFKHGYDGATLPAIAEAATTALETAALLRTLPTPEA